MASRKNIILVSGDSVNFVVDDGIIRASVVIKDIVEDIGIESSILLPNVKASELKTIIEYYKSCEMGREKQYCYKELMHLPLNDLIQLLYAANYLHMKPLLDICCELVSNHIDGRTQEYIRDAFHITDKFTPEQEEQLKVEHNWAFSNVKK